MEISSAQSQRPNYLLRPCRSPGKIAASDQVRTRHPECGWQLSPSCRRPVRRGRTTVKPPQTSAPPWCTHFGTWRALAALPAIAAMRSWTWESTCSRSGRMASTPHLSGLGSDHVTCRHPGVSVQFAAWVHRHDTVGGPACAQSCPGRYGTPRRRWWVTAQSPAAQTRGAQRGRDPGVAPTHDNQMPVRASRVAVRSRCDVSGARVRVRRLRGCAARQRRRPSCPRPGRGRARRRGRRPCPGVALR